MSDYKFGFIGVGNMGSALATAVSKSVSGNEIMLADKFANKAQVLSNNLNCDVYDNTAVAARAKFIFLGVKPQMLKETLDGIADTLARRTDRFILVSMAAGVQISSIKEMLGANYPIIRIMPNTPVLVGEGMILYTCNDEVFMDEISEFCDGLKFAGKLDKIPENLIDAASAVSGCGPAFVYMFAESLADAAVECGLPRAKAIEYAAQTLLGSAKMILKTSKHPAELKDEVCSPAGSTIEGVHALENSGFRAGVMNAVKSSYKRTKELGKN